MPQANKYFSIYKVAGGWKLRIAWSPRILAGIRNGHFAKVHTVLHPTRRQAVLAAEVFNRELTEYYADSIQCNLRVSKVEYATILAALRFWQTHIGPDNLPAQANVDKDFGFFFDGLPRMNKADIDTLCKRINS